VPQASRVAIACARQRNKRCPSHVVSSRKCMVCVPSRRCSLRRARAAATGWAVLRAAMRQRVCSRRFSCQAVAGVASSVRPASRHDSATRAVQAARVISSCALRQLVRSAMCELLECGSCCAPVSTCAHVCAPAAPCVHLLAPTRTRGCSRLGCGTRRDAAPPSRRFTCHAVANVASSVRPASRGDSATRADCLQRVITSCALRQLVRSAMCELPGIEGS
jgi:hypothetical protein